MLKLWLALLCLLSFNVNAEELKAILYISGDQELTQAQPREFEFQFYPVGEKTIDELEAIVPLGRFINHFYIFDIKEKGFSPNNHDVFVVSGRLVLVDVFRKNQMLPFKFNDKELYVEVRSGKPIALKSETQEIMYMSLPPISKLSFWEKVFYSILAFLILSALIAGGRKLFFIQRQKNAKKRKKANLLDAFSNAQTRDDYERLYRQREDWIALLGGKNPEAVTLLKDIEEVQYKKEWSESELEQIREKTQQVQKTIETI